MPDSKGITVYNLFYTSMNDSLGFEGTVGNVICSLVLHVREAARHGRSECHWWQLYRHSTPSFLDECLPNETAFLLLKLNLVYP